ncbi:hypothetical protein NA57DRAFT_76605 [Rhizodiscina lignyota]|uniref:RGS domain-containing protein n=1 Tax=Rhizodiscina lignyota TaxID=1504668 RepID=A0A9P4M7Y6_9PEZI|nr:hypothetical protein NA57DRAFT_76605 [Rhizodiscina lignyota]
MGSELGNTVTTKPQARLDAVGIFYLTLNGAWTLILVCAVAYLFVKRRLPFLRIRGLPLTFGAIFFLHMYWMTVTTGYCYGPLAPEVAEYWIMGLWLPFGIAMFQASNSQLLHVAKMQKRYARNGSIDEPITPKRNLSRWRIIRWFQVADYPTRMFTYVGLGMLFQLFLTVFVYLISRKFHRSFGIPGTEVHGTIMEQKVQQGRGWEWWPTIFWQLFWAWIIAPIILWRARSIHDTHGWRVQTIACCIAGLPAAPMWLIGLYVDGMAPVNQYWIPPQWIALSIMVIEIFTVLLPCWQVMRHQTLQQETLAAIALWESKNKTGSISESDYTGSTKMAKSAWESFKGLSAFESGRAPIDMSQPESIFTMGALEYALKINPEPLRAFAALKDFTGENIGFLTELATWKSAWPAQGNGDGQFNEALYRQQFNRAIHIYAKFVSPIYADFAINIGYRELGALDEVFEQPARILYGDRGTINYSSITPFDNPLGSSGSEIEMVLSPTSTVFPPEKSHPSHPDDTPINEISEKVQYWGDIPSKFDPDVFNRPERSIKYLVLTNTWPKFVKDGGEDDFERRSSFERVAIYFRTMRSNPA